MRVANGWGQTERRFYDPKPDGQVSNDLMIIIGHIGYNGKFIRLVFLSSLNNCDRR